VDKYSSDNTTKPSAWLQKSIATFPTHRKYFKPSKNFSDFVTAFSKEYKLFFIAKSIESIDFILQYMEVSLIVMRLAA